jgi:hypothetical protein
MDRAVAKRKQRTDDTAAAKTTQPPPAKRRAGIIEEEEQEQETSHPHPPHPWGNFGTLPLELMQTELKRWLPPQSVAVFYGATCSGIRELLYGRKSFVDCASLPVVVLQYKKYSRVRHILDIDKFEERCFDVNYNSDDDDDDNNNRGSYLVNYHAYIADPDTDLIHTGEEWLENEEDYIRFWSGAIHMPQEPGTARGQQPLVPVLLRYVRDKRAVLDVVDMVADLETRITELRNVYRMAVRAIELPGCACGSFEPVGHHEMALHTGISELLVRLAATRSIYIDWIHMEAIPAMDNEVEPAGREWRDICKNARLPFPPTPPLPRLPSLPWWNDRAISKIATTVYVERPRDGACYELEYGEVGDDRLYWRATQLSRMLPRVKVVLDPICTVSGWLETLTEAETTAAAAAAAAPGNGNVIVRELCLANRYFCPTDPSPRWLPITEPHDAQLAAMKTVIRRDKTTLVLPILLYTPEAHRIFDDYDVVVRNNNDFDEIDGLSLNARCVSAWCTDLAASASAVLLSTLSVAVGRAPDTPAHAAEIGHALDPYVTHIYSDTAHRDIFASKLSKIIKASMPTGRLPLDRLEARLARYPNARGMVLRSGRTGSSLLFSRTLEYSSEVARHLGFAIVKALERQREIVIEWPGGSAAPTDRLARLVKALDC